VVVEKLSGSYTAQEILDQRIPGIEVIGKGRGRRYGIEGLNSKTRKQV